MVFLFLDRRSYESFFNLKYSLSDSQLSHIKLPLDLKLQFDMKYPRVFLRNTKKGERESIDSYNSREGKEKIEAG